LQHTGKRMCSSECHSYYIYIINAPPTMCGHYCFVDLPDETVYAIKGNFQKVTDMFTY